MSRLSVTVGMFCASTLAELAVSSDRPAWSARVHSVPESMLRPPSIKALTCKGAVWTS